ncbi:MAG: alpha-L-rhamnosidase [Saprospiraceae bacterium]|nr:alpha-L-rhamnosidase [Saprospiraceae bacterium]
MNKVILACLLSLSLLKGHAQYLPPPSGLSTAFLRVPSEAVITDSTPDFAWIFPQAGLEQSAYRVLVASSPFLLLEGDADLWDSEMVISDASTNVTYSGRPLDARQTYWWQVKVWSPNGLESNYSLPQKFNTGDFDRSELDYPGESRWIQLATDHWVSEDKQCATFEYAKPIEMRQLKSKKYFAEFEKSAIGILEFVATSALDEAPITIHMGERKLDDVTVHKDPGKSNIGYDSIQMVLKKGTHNYVVEITEREIKGYLHSQKLSPHYPEVMPFRYVEILANFDSIAIKDIKQGGLFYYFDVEASSFMSSNEKLNTVWNLCKYTQKATPFLGVYADGNRERMPYEADANIQQASHFAVDREYSIGKYTINFLLDHASWPTEWQMHVVLMAWDYYMHTGDSDLLIDRYQDIRRKSLIALTDDNGLISTRTGKKTQKFLTSIHFPGPVEKFRDIVDWPHGTPKGNSGSSHRSPLEGGETDGFVFTDYNTVVNAFHNRSLVLMANIAKVVGNEEDHKFFTGRAEEHKKQFIVAFFNNDKDYFRDGIGTSHSSLHSNMFSMAFDLVPAGNIETVSEFIKSRGMVCSVYGSQYLLEALYKAGEAEYALELMTSEGRRSWLNMIRVGSSMTTEAWDEYYKPNLTWNHAWGSAPANITARKLMGIEPLEATFSKFRIAPQPGNLEQVAITVPCIRGEIAVDLNQMQDSWTMNISVPGNAKAELWLPPYLSKIFINGELTVPVNEVRYAGGIRNVILLESGHYTVSCSKK